MERMQHFHGKLMLDGQLVAEGVEGYLGSHERKNAAPSFFGHVDLTEETAAKIQQGQRYRLVLDDRRAGDIFLDLHASNQTGHRIGEFHVIGKFGK